MEFSYFGFENGTCPSYFQSQCKIWIINYTTIDVPDKKLFKKQVMATKFDINFFFYWDSKSLYFIQKVYA